MVRVIVSKDVFPSEHATVYICYRLKTFFENIFKNQVPA